MQKLIRFAEHGTGDVVSHTSLLKIASATVAGVKTLETGKLIVEAVDDSIDGKVDEVKSRRVI